MDNTESKAVRTQYLDLPPELWGIIFGFLDYRSLCCCEMVCQSWKTLICHVKAWKDQCKYLWSDKSYIPVSITQRFDSGEWKQAFRLSLEDSKRTWITEEELCSIEWWSIRFKEAAGPDWVSRDGWWDGKDTFKLRFRMDGSCIDNFQNVLPFRWRFPKTGPTIEGETCDNKPVGSFFRINNYPPMRVFRYQNWGFVMESCWAVYTSFPMPPRGVAPDLEDAALPITLDAQMADVQLFRREVEEQMRNYHE